MLKALGYHTIAKIFVVFAAYLLHYSLGRILKVDEYGVVGTMISFCNFYYMFLTNGVRQGISKMLSEGIYDRKNVIRTGVILQLVLSIGLAALNYISAPWFAKAFGNQEFIVYVRLISVLIPLTGIYFALTGALNGLKLFFCEAIVISVYPLLRLSAVPLAFFSASEKPAGVISGFSLASLLSAVLAFCFLVFNIKKRGKETSKKKVQMNQFLQVSFEFIFFFAAVTIVLNLDTFFLQYVCKDSVLTGYYTGVHTFSLVPYYLISAFYLVVLPFISEKYAQNKTKEIRDLIKKNLNIIIVFVLPLVVLISCTASELLASFYNNDYYQAGSALSVLVFGTFFLSFYAFLNVILNGMNCKKISKVLSFMIILLDVFLLHTLIPIEGILGAAIATCVSSAIGCISAFVYLIKKIGLFWDTALVMKALGLIVGHAIVCRLFFHFIPVYNLIALIGIYVILGVSYLLWIIKLKMVDYYGGDIR